MLTEIREWLDAHPKEVVVLSFSHFLGLSQELHAVLLTTIRTVFASKLCPKKVRMHFLFPETSHRFLTVRVKPAQNPKVPSVGIKHLDVTAERIHPSIYASSSLAPPTKCANIKTDCTQTSYIKKVYFH